MKQVVHNVTLLRQTPVLQNHLINDFFDQTNVVPGIYLKRIFILCFSPLPLTASSCSLINCLVDQHHKRLCNCRTYMDHKYLSNGCYFPSCSGEHTDSDYCSTTLTKKAIGKLVFLSAHHQQTIKHGDTCRQLGCNNNCLLLWLDKSCHYPAIAICSDS